MKLSEQLVENACLEWLSGLGYAVAHGPDISPEGSAPERTSYDAVLLTSRLREALQRLNPRLPAETLEEVLRKVRQTETPSLVEENRRLHRYLIEGVPVEVARDDGSIAGDVARLIDCKERDTNDWLAVNQYTVVENGHNRRPDIVLFVNGLPLAVIELKNPGDEHATLQGAFNQLQTYKDRIPSLFRTNAVLVTSDGLNAHVGSLTADIERFMPWRTAEGAAVAPKGVPELETLIEGVFEKSRFLTLIRDFTVFGDTGAGPSQDRRWLSPVPRGAPRSPEHGRGGKPRRQPPHRRHLAHAGLRQEPAHGLLRRTDHRPPGDGKPDHPRHHRPQ